MDLVLLQHTADPYRTSAVTGPFDGCVVVFSDHRNPQRTVLSVTALGASLSKGPFTAVQSGTGTSPIQTATIDR